jgi:hypothetical protein
MSKHTPGPWRYARENGSPTTGQHMIAGGRPGYLAEVRDCGSGNVIANSLLISAAPDLLQVAKNFVEWFECDRIADKPTVELEQARAAIAKATGEQA